MELNENNWVEFLIEKEAVVPVNSRNSWHFIASTLWGQFKQAPGELNYSLGIVFWLRFRPQFVGCMQIRNSHFSFLREAFMRRNSKSEMWFIYKIAANSNNKPSDVFMLLRILFWFSNSRTNIKEWIVENFQGGGNVLFILIIILWALLVKKSWCLIVRRPSNILFGGNLSVSGPKRIKFSWHKEFSCSWIYQKLEKLNFEISLKCLTR